MGIKFLMPIFQLAELTTFERILKKGIKAFQVYPHLRIAGLNQYLKNQGINNNLEDLLLDYIIQNPPASTISGRMDGGLWEVYSQKEIVYISALIKYKPGFIGTSLQIRVW